MSCYRELASLRRANATNHFGKRLIFLVLLSCVLGVMTPDGRANAEQSIRAWWFARRYECRRPLTVP